MFIRPLTTKHGRVLTLGRRSSIQLLNSSLTSCLENKKKKNFLVRISAHIYGAIFESSNHSDLFPNHQNVKFMSQESCKSKQRWKKRHKTQMSYGMSVFS